MADHPAVPDPDGAAPLPRLVLASASPRRAELLATLGLTFSVEPADVDESVHEDEVPATYVKRVALAKAAAVAATDPTALVVAADTTVVLDDEILGKPVDAGAARSMLGRLAGRTHEVLTAVVASTDDPTGSRVAVRVTSTAVTFAPIADAALDWYLATGEPFDKAGAYGIQGAGGLFVTRIDGSYHNVVGLPLDVLRELVAEVGFDLLAWSR